MNAGIGDFDVRVRTGNRGVRVSVSKDHRTANISWTWDQLVYAQECAGVTQGKVIALAIERAYADLELVNDHEEHQALVGAGI